MREVRNSLIPWLPVIPANWNEVRLKDIGTARNGLTYKPDDLVEEHQGSIVLRSSNIQNSKLSFNDNVFVKSFPEELRVLKNDIIICSRNGSVSLVGKCALIEHDINATFGAFMMRFRTTQHPKFSFYLLQSTISAYKSRFGTTTVNQLTNSVFGNMLTALPPKEEQEAIAAYLDKECEKIGSEIELLERKADAYSRLRRSIINRAVTRGLNPNVSLKPSGIPWIASIPAHWHIKRGKSIFQEVYRDVRPEDGTVTCFRDGEVTLRTNRRTTGFTESEKEIGYHGVRVGDLVIHQMDAFAGSIGISDSDGKCSPICIVCQPLHNDEADLGYYCQLLRVMAHSGFIQSLAKGIRERTTDFRYKTLGTLHFPVPPYQEQQEIAAYLDEKCGKIDAIIEKIGTKVERLKELKRSLINEVVTGKRAIIN